MSTALNMAPLPVVANTTAVVVPPPDINNDFEYARTNMYDAITKGQDALNELILVAKATQEARPYEVVSILINTIVAANKDLLDIHKKHQDLSKTNEPSNKTNINNNLVISSAELLSMLKSKVNEQ